MYISVPTMLKILYITSTLKRCGPINQLYFLLQHLENESFQPNIVTLSPELLETRWDDFVPICHSIRTLSLTRIESILFGYVKLKKVLMSYSPDIIHSQGIRADFLSALMPSNFKRIATIHNYPQEDLRMTYGNAMGMLLTFLQSMLLGELDAISGVSEPVSQNIYRRYGLRAQSINNGIDLDTFFPVLLTEKRAIRKELDILPDAFVFIATGHLAELKDPLTIIRAFKKISNTNLHLFFLGDGPLIDECKACAKGNSNIKFVGRTKNVIRYLHAADCFLSASHIEGMPMAVLEALACGLPCILSSIPPHQEIQCHGREACFLFDVGNIGQLAALMDQVANRKDPFNSRKAVDVVRLHFNAKTMAQQYQALYESLVSS
jgi:glycosyltransferase involved in cell wall biosynthesis